MALNTTNEQAKRKIFLSIAHGKIRHTNKATGNIEYYASVEGTLISITKQERHYNGKAELFWYIDLRDGEDIFSLSFPYASGAFKSIINSLASDMELTASTIIRIEPYEKNNFTKVVVYSEGVKLDWAVKEMPAVVDVKLPNGMTAKDDRARMQFIEELVGDITERLSLSK